MKQISPRSFHLLTVLVVLIDFFCLQLALIVGYWLWMTYRWHGNYQLFSDFSQILLILPIIGIIVFRAIGLYKPQMGVLGVQEQSLIFKGTWITYITVFALSFFYRTVEFSRLALTYSFFLSLILVSTERFLMRRVFEALNQLGFASRQALIYGAGYQGQRLERWIRQSPQMGIHVVGYLDDDVERLVKKPEFPPLLGELGDLEKCIRKKNISLLFVAHRVLSETKIIEIIRRAREFDVECWVIPALYRFYVEKIELQNIGGIPLVSFREGFARRSYGKFKWFLDFLLALFLAVVLAPLFLLISFGVFITLRRPVFFKQVRIGQGGTKFTMYKFRTLRKEFRKEEVSPELQKGLKDKSVVSRFALFLRRTGLDELPQLFNVLKGEMSFVGPRPEMPFLVEKYGPLERERLELKPGITGLWQISRDRKRILIHENMDYDLYYVEHLSPNLDLAILVKTVWTVLSRFLGKGP